MAIYDGDRNESKPEATVSYRKKPQSGESLHKALMKMGIVRASCPIAGDYNQIIAGFYPRLLQTIFFAYAAAYPIAHNSTSELHSDRNAETIDSQPIFADVDSQKGIYGRLAAGIGASEVTIFFD